MKSEIEEQIKWDEFAESRLMRTPRSELPCGGDNCHVGALWTREDYVTLIRMAKPDAKISDICLELRRSKAGVVAAIGRLRIAFVSADNAKLQYFSNRLCFSRLVYANNVTIKKFNLMEVFVDEGWTPEYHSGNRSNQVKLCLNPYYGKSIEMGEFEKSISRRKSENERKLKSNQGKNRKVV